MIDPRLIDHAKNILENAPLSDTDRADCWDCFHNAKSSAHLATALNSV
jgi:hypothetical protein